MNTTLDQYVIEFCSSEHFVLCNEAAYQYSESLLHFWCEHIEEPLTISSLEKSLREIAVLETVPLEVRKRFPELLEPFFNYLQSTGRLPVAGEWVECLDLLKNSFTSIFRDDGTVRGTTFRKKYYDVNRNDPFPVAVVKNLKNAACRLFQDNPYQ